MRHGWSKTQLQGTYLWKSENQLHSSLLRAWAPAAGSSLQKLEHEWPWCLLGGLEVPAPDTDSLRTHPVGPYYKDPGFWEHHLSLFLQS